MTRPGRGLITTILVERYTASGIECVTNAIVFSVRASPSDGLVALNLGGTIATLVLLLLAEATQRQPFFDLAVVSAVLSFAGGLAYARFLERWL